MCIVYAPRTFAHDEDSKAIADESSQDPIATIHVAVDACPTGALSVVEI